MRAFEARHAVCDRARQWASLRIDGELSQLEEALLEAHLSGCAQCEAFVRDARATTVVLRGAVAERPSYPVAIPVGRRSALGAVRALSAAAAIVVGAVGVGALFGSLEVPQRDQGGSTRVVAIVDEQKLLREPRVLMQPGFKRGIGISI